MSDIATLLERARANLSKAYVPYSHFPVSACLKTSDGQFYSGVNIENASYGLTICAERSAICQLISQQGHAIIRDILVISNSDKHCAPCGACRQVLAEFSDVKTRIHMCTAEGAVTTMSLADLLPHSFGPSYLQEV